MAGVISGMPVSWSLNKVVGVGGRRDFGEGRCGFTGWEKLAGRGFWATVAGIFQVCATFL